MLPAGATNGTHRANGKYTQSWPSWERERKKKAQNEAVGRVVDRRTGWQGPTNSSKKKHTVKKRQIDNKKSPLRSALPIFSDHLLHPLTLLSLGGAEMFEKPDQT